MHGEHDALLARYQFDDTGWHSAAMRAAFLLAASGLHRWPVSNLGGRFTGLERTDKQTIVAGKWKLRNL